MTQDQTVILGMLIFLIWFLGLLVWVSIKANKERYQELGVRLLDEGR